MSTTNIIEGCRESAQNEQDTEADNTPERKTRVRLKSPRLQLQVTLQRMEKLAQSNTLKEAKAADLLMSMAELQKMLLQLTLDTERSALEEENKQLKSRIEELTAELTEKSKPEVSQFLAQLNAVVPTANTSAASAALPTPAPTPSVAAPTAPTHIASPKPSATRDIHSVQEELIECERQENADRQATMNIAWRRQMGL